jgi:hypothetical protein
LTVGTAKVGMHMQETGLVAADDAAGGVPRARPSILGSGTVPPSPTGVRVVREQW